LKASGIHFLEKKMKVNNDSFPKVTSIIAAPTIEGFLGKGEI
jgi:hypothetical protein